MADYSKIIASLSPEKRALLELKLKKQGSDYNSFPLSFAQQRMWFIDQLEPGNPVYNIPVAYRLEGRLDIAALEKSINEIVRRHEILRTTFTALNGQPIQVVAPDLKLSLPVMDLRGKSRSEQESLVQSLATEEARKSFDLAKGPLLRMTLLKLEDEEHVALLIMHHIISDGWSMGVLIREIATLYEVLSTNSPSPLPELSLQYADFARWQRQRLEGDLMETQLDYWKKLLGENPPVLQLPTDHPRPAMLTFQGSFQSVELPKSLSEELNALCRQEGVTPFMTLLAAFQTLLHRYTGQNEINVGSPIANRTRAETEALIGFFVNTLVLHSDLSGDPSFRELLARVKEMTLGAYAHQDLPFEKLVEAIQPDRDMSHTPLFQVMFVLQNTPTRPLKTSNLTISLVPFDRGVTQFDLTLNLVESENGLKGMVEYNSAIFEAATIRRMVNHFQMLLESIVANPDQRISALNILPAAEREQLLVKWNSTEAAYQNSKCLHQLFELQAEQNPNAIALMFKAEKLTYFELNRRANQLAHYLQKKGVGPEVLVGICVERSIEMMVGIMGILKAGGAYVPMDPNYPTERISFILEDTQIPILLTQKRIMESLPIHWTEVICFETDWNMISQESDTNIPTDSSPENIAYIIFTSGSTGKPKGVQIQHGSVINLVNSYIKIFDCKIGERVGQFFSYSFDGSVGDIFMALTSGATLCLVDESNRIPGPGLNKLMREHEISIIVMPPPILAVLSEEGLTKLRVVGAGGESPTRELIARWAAGGRPFFNVYGPTEATVIVTSYLLNDLPEEANNMPIGRPIDNTQLFLLDAKLQPVPIGVLGELYIGGDGLSRGYLNRPDITAERFIPHPFSQQAGSRLYKTGDLVKYLPDGNIEFLGRIDHQVKVRGFRIELGEIEAILGQIPELKETTVIVREDKPGDKRLVAYVVPAQGVELDMGQIRTSLKEKLPEYMIPSAFVTLDVMPLTAHGKIDRRALPAPDWSQRDAEKEYVAPRNPIEEMLAEIFSKILNVERVGVQDNFFELGGHSLLATQVISRLREVFKVELQLRELFEAPVVADLALRIEQAQRNAQGLSASPISQTPREGELPLSFAQQRLWFLDQLEPNTALYNIPTGVRLAGKLNVDALEQSINEIVRRHEILRTTFTSIDGRASQTIAPSVTIPLPIVDLQTAPENERESKALQFATVEAKKPFDLSTGPLLRTLLIRLSQEDHIIVLTMHHIISDGWSSGILINEVAALYDAFSNEKPSPLPDLPIQYADFSHWQRNWLQGEVLETQLNYWKGQLSDSPALLELPTDFPRPAVQTSHGAHYTFSIPSDLSNAVKNLSCQEGVTQFMTLLAAFQTLLHKYSGQQDICVGTPIANRNRSEIENLIGFFVNTLVIRSQVKGNIGFKQFLSRVRETTLGAYAHQDLPFEKIVDAVQPNRDMSHSPLFQVMFMLQNISHGGLALEGLTLNSIELETGISTFDLTLSLSEGENGFTGAFEYNTDLFKAATIEKMVIHFQRLLAAIIANPDGRISNLTLLTEAERSQIVDQWNDTERAYPAEQCLHHLFEAQVNRTPDAIAVVSDRGELTYFELNKRANQLAHALRKHGIGPDDLVGICVNRSLEMIVGLLGILKAGGGYVPLDPNYPGERLTFMMEDSQVSVLLTQQSLVKSLPPHQAKMICLDRDWQMIAQESGENFENGVAPHNLAYVIYTSGSTGQPKGVMVEHQSVLNHNVAVQAKFGLQPTDRVLQFATINFDTAVEEIFPTLFSGATLVLRSADGVLASGADLMDLIEKYRLTVLDLPTAYWHEWVYEMTLLERAIPDSLRLVIVGGDKASAERFATWERKVGSAIRWLNTYGPTEGTIIATAFEPDTRETTFDAGAEVPIGRPIANAKIHILDKHMQPVPPMIPGEMYIGGISVVRGYLHRPDLTAEKFVPDPFSRKPGARLYNTGDLARYLSDGNVEFIGRADHQVKVRGFRIELAEIEAELEKHPLIREAVVIAKEESPSSKRLIAYCVPAVDDLEKALGKRRHVRVPFLSEASLDFNGNQKAQFKTEDISEGGARLMTISPLPNLDQNERMHMAMSLPIEPKRIQIDSHLIWRNGESLGVAFRDVTATNQELLKETITRLMDSKVLLMNELRSFLKERLPDYMIPASFMIVASLPRTLSGKIDRRALPEPEQIRIDSESVFIAPRDEVEEKLADIWRQVLGVKQIGVNDNFFELGGDSILSIQVIAKANQAGLQLSPKQFFEHPTIAGLSAVAGVGQAIQAEQGLVTGQISLTPIQRWFFEQNSPEPHHYNQSLFFEVKETLEPEILQQAIEKLYLHHDALRLRFQPNDSGWEAFIADIDEADPFVCIDLAATSDAELKSEIEKITHATQSSLNLEAGPIMRVVLLNLGQGRTQRLLLVIHHLAMDGVSWRILLGDLQNAYQQIKLGKEVQLPPKSTSYKYWAEKLSAYSRSSKLHRELEYWASASQRHFASIPSDFVDGANIEASEQTVVISLSKEETVELLQEVPVAYHTQINDLLLASLAQACYRFTGSRHLLLDLEGHGREPLFEDVDLSRTVGWFTSIYPVLLDLKNSKAPGEVVKTIKEQLRQIPNNGIGYGLLRYLSQQNEIIEALQELPKAEICFNYLGQFDQMAADSKIFGSAAESKGHDRSLKGARSHLIEINGSVSGGKLQLEWHYSDNLYRRSTIERLAQHFLIELQTIISHCKSPEAGGFTPSDFKLAKFDQKKLDKVMQKLGKRKEKVVS